jgi:aminotransferase
MNHTLETIAPYASKRISQMAKADPQFVSLSIGEPWFGPAPAVAQILEDMAGADLQATKYALSHYANGKGESRLREAVAARHQRTTGVSIDPDKNIIITHGGSQAFLLALLACTDEGDEVVVPDPTYMLYSNTCTLLGRIAVRPPKREADGFILSPSDLQHCITSRTRMVVVNSPENPTGVVYTENELRGLYDICDRAGVVMLQDEVYDSYVLEGRHSSCTSFDPALRNAIQLNSTSKRYGLPGLRIGWLVANDQFIRAAAKALEYVSLSVSGLSHYVAEKILGDSGTEAWIGQVKSEIRTRRDLLYESLARVGFQFPARGGCGGFFLFPNVRAFKGVLDSSDARPIGDQFAEWIAKRAKIAVVPGSVYGPQGNDFIRLVTTGEMNQIEEAIRRFQDALSSKSMTAEN